MSTSFQTRPAVNMNLSTLVYEESIRRKGQKKLAVASSTGSKVDTASHCGEQRSHSIQFKIVYLQHNIVNTTMVSCMRRVEKGTSRRHRLCGLVPYLNNIDIYNTQLPIGDSDLNNQIYQQS